MSQSQDEMIASPCISVCTVDRVRGMCIGCLRTLDEIGGWRIMTIEQKKAVIEACAERAKVFSPRDKSGVPLKTSPKD